MEINKAELASAAAVSSAVSVPSGSSTQELRGAEILVKSLQAEGVKYVWGYPGGAVLHIYDAFYKQDTIQHVLVRHEQAAVHAADGYARATGEGSVQMCIQELSTCLQYNTPIKIVSLNNRYLGMVRQWQEVEYEGRYSHSYMDALPNFVKLAEAYGHVGMLIEQYRDVEPALREARKLKDRTVFMDFRTDPTENVFPMVMAGKGITEMLLGSEDL